MDQSENTTFGKILLWLQRYTKTDMMYLARGGFWTLLSQIVITLTTFGLAVAFAHFIPKETYGEYKYILSIASILGLFTLTGLNNALVKSVTLGFEGSLKDAFWKNIKWSGLFYVITLGVATYYFINGNIVLGVSMIIVGIFSPIINSTNLYDSYLTAKKDFKRSAIYFNMIGNTIPSICLFLAILITHKTLWLIFVFFASNTIIGILLYLRIINIYKPNERIDEGIVKYSKHLSIIKILAGLAGNLDQILVFHFIGPAQLAIYNFALAIPSQVKGPVKSMSSLILPKFAEGDEKYIRKGMRNKYLVVLATSIVFIAIYVFIAPYFFKIFFPKYIDSIFYSQILSFSLIGVVSIPVETYFVAKEKIKEQYIVNILWPIIQIITMVFFMIQWGLLGLVLARVITKILWSLINILLYEIYTDREMTVSSNK